MGRDDAAGEASWESVGFTDAASIVVFVDGSVSQGSIVSITADVAVVKYTLPTRPGGFHVGRSGACPACHARVVHGRERGSRE